MTRLLDRGEQKRVIARLGFRERFGRLRVFRARKRVKIWSVGFE